MVVEHMGDKMTPQSFDGKVVFFDGECGLCDRFVQLLIRIDKHKRLRFAPLQGATSLATFGEASGDPQSWSIKFVDGRGSYLRSTAALLALSSVGGVWSLAKLLLIFPTFVRDSVYRVVATHRYRWYGKLDSCMLPSPTLRERFLP